MGVWQILHIGLACTIGLRFVRVYVALYVWCLKLVYCHPSPRVSVKKDEAEHGFHVSLDAF